MEFRGRNFDAFSFLLVWFFAMSCLLLAHSFFSHSYFLLHQRQLRGLPVPEDLCSLCKLNECSSIKIPFIFSLSVPVPMPGWNCSSVHKGIETAKPLDQTQQLHLNVIGPRSLLEMGLGARPQEPSTGVLTSESFCLLWAPCSKTSVRW